MKIRDGGFHFVILFDQPTWTPKLIVYITDRDLSFPIFSICTLFHVLILAGSLVY